MNLLASFTGNREYFASLARSMRLVAHYFGRFVCVLNVFGRKILHSATCSAYGVHVFVEAIFGPIEVSSLPSTLAHR